MSTPEMTYVLTTGDLYVADVEPLAWTEDPRGAAFFGSASEANVGLNQLKRSTVGLKIMKIVKP